MESSAERGATERNGTAQKATRRGVAHLEILARRVHALERLEHLRDARAQQRAVVVERERQQVLEQLALPHAVLVLGEMPLRASILALVLGAAHATLELTPANFEQARAWRHTRMIRLFRPLSNCLFRGFSRAQEVVNSGKSAFVKFLAPW